MTATATDVIRIDAVKAMELLRAANEEYRVGDGYYADRVKQFIPPDPKSDIWADPTVEDPNHLREIPKCYYVLVDSEDKPQVGCLVGAAMVKAGVPLEAMAGPGNARTINAIVSDHAWDSVVHLSPGALDVLRVAQAAQDAGKTWDVALERAEQALSQALAEGPA